ncbi:hypothetical protein AKJ16_DCAP11640 [Drosera capensis]
MSIVRINVLGREGISQGIYAENLQWALLGLFVNFLAADMRRWLRLRHRHRNQTPIKRPLHRNPSSSLQVLSSEDCRVWNPSLKQ